MQPETEPKPDDEADTEPPAPLCGKKGRSAGHILHCDYEMDHRGRCSFERDFEP